QEILENPLGIFLLFPCSKFNHFVNLPVVDKQFYKNSQIKFFYPVFFPVGKTIFAQL
ncbi:MAG: hypothetical protein FD181_3794, partial [Prolixibacteraceae bacterium]